MLFVVSHHVYFYNIVIFVLQNKTKNTNMNKNNTETNIVLNQLPQKLQTRGIIMFTLLIHSECSQN